MAYFNNEIIILDLKKNQYLILNEELSTSLFICTTRKIRLDDSIYILDEGKGDNREVPQNFHDAILLFQKQGIISDKLYTSPKKVSISKNKSRAGIANIDWGIEEGNLHMHVPLLLCIEAYFKLVKVYFILKFFGFEKLIKSVQSLVSSKKNVKKVKSDKFKLLVSSLNRASFYFPIRPKCLEWSTALALMALKRGFLCNLEIGVQTLPLMAHAWVRSPDGVIADDANLPIGLSVVLSEPFGEI